MHTLANGKLEELTKCATQWDYGEALSHSMRRCDKYTNTVEHIQLLKGVRTGQGVGNARTGQGVKNVRMSQSVKSVENVTKRENVKIVAMSKSWKIVEIVKM